MPIERDIHIFVDSSVRMHVKIDHKRTAINKVYKFLSYLARKSDSQPCYIDKVHIHVGNEYISLEEGKAAESIRGAKELFKKSSNEIDHLSVWRTALDCDKQAHTMYFIATSVVDDRIINMFDMHKKRLLFLDFSGKKIKLRKENRKRVQVIKYKDLVKAAKMIHRKFLSDYITTVNLGFSIKTEFITVPVNDHLEVDLESIDLVGMTSYEPAEYISVLAMSFIMPLDKCYDGKGAKVDSTLGYQVLKDLLGEELNDDSEGGESKDTTKSELLDDSLSESRNLTSAMDHVQMEENKDEMVQDIKEEVKEENEEEVEEKESEPSTSTPKKSTRKKKQIFESLAEDDSEDEEYTPKKKRGPKRGARGGGSGGRGSRGGKRKRVVESEEEDVLPPKRGPRRSTRGRKSDPVKEEEPEEPVEEPPAPEPPAPEPVQPAQEPEKTEEGGEEIKEEPKEEEEIPLPRWLFGRAKDRLTGIYRPVILRLHALDEDDKTYYTPEELILKEEEAAKKKLEEEEEEARKLEEQKAEIEQSEREKAMKQQELLQFQNVQQHPTTDDSPASPPAYDCPASPDMSPSTSQPVKIIPTVAIPLEQDVPKDVDYRNIPRIESRGDVDYRRPQNVPTAPANVTTSDGAEPGELLDSDFDEDDGELGELVDETYGSDDEPLGDDDVPHELVDEYNAVDDPESDEYIPRGEPRVAEAAAPEYAAPEVAAPVAAAAEVVAPDADVPEEPSEENLLPVQQEPVKNIPIESCIVTEEAEENKIDEITLDEPSEDKKNEEGKPVQEKSTGMKYIQVIVLDMSWDQFMTQIAFEEDEEALEEITERERTVVGEEPFHDYTQLTGWYSDEAMQFYINKMFRALRKLHERSHLFETEYRHMTQMIVYGQNPELARTFAMLMVDDIDIYSDETIAIAEQASRHFEQMYNQMIPQRPRRHVLLPDPRYSDHRRQHHQGHQMHHGHQIHPGHATRQMNQPHHQNYHQPHHQRFQRTPQKQHHGHYSHHPRY